ncbi:MAG: glycosyltransferase family 4 protein [Archangium sp.]|nr:glycosyltransferase family 4 protein [Archangium sp.]
MTVHQLVPTFTPGDAMGAAAVGFRRALRRLGATGELFAGETAVPALVRPASQLRAEGRDTLVLYHHGIASPLAGQLMHLRCATGVVFHNITPARMYAGTRLEEPLRAGRAQLAALASTVDVSLAVSNFNARELLAAGHAPVHVVPLFIEPERFAATTPPSPRPMTMLSVSRVVAHKRVSDVVALHREVRSLVPDARLRLVGATSGDHRAFAALQREARAVGGVDFVGRVSHAQLVAEYRGADVYVSMSEHEGVGVPLLEAMAADVPVLAFGAAAVPETMGGQGLVFDTKHFAALAEVVALLRADDSVRTALVEGQRKRVREFSIEATEAALASALAPFAPPAPRKRRTVRPKVTVVVQRFGESLVGGAEAHARQIAQRLTEHATVEVLTTTADDHLTWRNALLAGESRDGAMRVHRFPTLRAREMRAFNRFSREVFAGPNDFVREEQWVAEQGPVSPELIHAIAQRAHTSDAFIFFTALYAPTAWGLPLVADKALLVPTAHDEPPMQLRTYDDAFTRPRALICNTAEEVAFIRQRFPGAARARVVGVGVEAVEASPDTFRQRFGIDGPYLLYVGRLEEGKGVPELLRFHRALCTQFHDAPTLVLAGAGSLRPSGARVRCVGRIDEADKWSALNGALAVVVPSRFESLSLLALEGFAAGVPVIATAHSEVLAGHVKRSRAGLTYTDAPSFIDAVRRAGAKRATFVPRARAYAKRFTWGAVMRTYLEEIDALRR